MWTQLNSIFCQNRAIIQYYATPTRSECGTSPESNANSPCHSTSKDQVQPLPHPPISFCNLRTVYPNSNSTPEHLGCPRIYHRLPRHDLDNNLRAAAVDSTWAVGIARHRELDHKAAGMDLEIDIPGPLGRRIDFGLEAGCLDSGLLAKHRSFGA
jgi:hypothetical protein